MLNFKKPKHDPLATFEQVTGITLRRPEQKQVVGLPPSAASKLNHTQSEIDYWMLDHYKEKRNAGLPPPKRDMAVRDCRAALQGAGVRPAIEAWRKVPDYLKQSVGRPRSQKSTGK